MQDDEDYDFEIFVLTVINGFWISRAFVKIKLSTWEISL
jgi:hypothetical protein